MAPPKRITIARGLFFSTSGEVRCPPGLFISSGERGNHTNIEGDRERGRDLVKPGLKFKVGRDHPFNSFSNE